MPLSECSELTARHIAAVRDQRFGVSVVMVVEETELLAEWAAELEELLLRVGRRFSRADLRWRMRAYVRGLLGSVSRKNGWQLAEFAGHSTPDGLQNLLNR
ncbi:hypothetical protein ACIBLA_36065, partial [Streptomyces sp. NPDC050433]